jgi:hypothetical protein
MIVHVTRFSFERDQLRVIPQLQQHHEEFLLCIEHNQTRAQLLQLTTMPMSVLVFMSTVWSSTTFMN